MVVVVEEGKSRDPQRGLSEEVVVVYEVVRRNLLRYEGVVHLEVVVVD